MTQRFPLLWPLARPRTKNRRTAAFNKKVPKGNHMETRQLSIADALGRLQAEVDLLKVSDYTLSTNLALRLDGLPRGDQGNPADPGVALYFTLKGEPHCLPCDTYDRVADNIAAIAKHIEATRAIERFGVASLKEMFTGFTALPAPGAQRPWRVVLGLEDMDPVYPVNVEEAYRALAKKAHPNAPGGSHDAMVELNRAKDEALKEVRK